LEFLFSVLIELPFFGFGEVFERGSSILQSY